MTDVVGLLAYLVLPLAGLWVWRLKGVRELALDARIAIAGAAGALFTATIMAAMALAGLAWSRTRLVAALTFVVAGGVWAVTRAAGWRRRGTPAHQPPGRQRLAGVFIAILFVITLYGLLSARETSGDLLYFWGPKGVHFDRARTIDVDFLRSPHRFLMHRDYPPLLPLLFAWSNVLSSEFSWWAAVLLSGLCLAAIVALVRACARDNLAALLAASILAWTFAKAQLAGGADPLLLLFEAIVVVALLVLRDARSQIIVAAIGMGGAVVTKVEGASFAMAVILACFLDRRSVKRIASIVLPAVVLLGGWLAFLVRANLVDTYLGPGTLTFRYWPEVLKGTLAAASYDALWIPWIAPLVVVFLGDVRRARLPLSIAALSIGATLYVYLKSPFDPSVFWIPSSAPRVLLTPLVMLLVAAASAHAPALFPTPGGGDEQVPLTEDSALELPA
jgi:hypothetical protein